MSLIEARKAAEAFFPYASIGEAVKCESYRTEFDHWKNHLEFKMCYNNAYQCLADAILNGYATDDIKYVLGAAVHYIPVDHAWVRIGDTYYDPTWETFDTLGHYYFPVHELSPGQIHRLVEANRMTPPALWQMNKLLTIVDL